MKTSKAQSDTPPNIEKVVLDSLKVRMSKHFGRYTLEKMRVGVARPLVDHVLDVMELRITTDILGQSKRMLYNVELDVPDGWWNQLKYERFPPWLQRISPIKWKTIHREFALDHWALLPEFDKVPPDEKIVMFTSIPANEPGIRSKY